MFNCLIGYHRRFVNMAGAVFFLILLHHEVGYAQQASVFQIDSKNGLSSDHVYFTHVDKLGYLWLGTTDGLYRYNGYEFKRYGYDEGLLNTDIWNLTEDSKGRLWLHAISPAAGYIKNNKYKQVPFSEKNELKMVYPYMISELGDSIVFAIRTQSTYRYIDIGIVYKDTFYWENLVEAPQVVHKHIIGDKVLNLAGVGLGNVSKLKDELSGGKLTKLKPINAELTQKLAVSTVCLGFNGLVFLFEPHDTCVRFYNIGADSLTKIVLKDRKGTAQMIDYAVPLEDTCYAFVRDKVYAIDTGLVVRTEYSVSALYPDLRINPLKNTHFVNDKNWGKCLSTSDRGAYINVDKQTSIGKAAMGLDKYSFINSDEGFGYWWSDEDSEIKVLSGNREVKSVGIKNKSNVRRIRTINENLQLINTYNATLFQIDGAIYDAHSFLVYEYINGVLIEAKLSDWVSMKYMVDCVPIDSNTFYEVSTGALGLNRVSISMTDSAFNSVNIDKVRYQSGFYNDRLKLAVFCSKSRITIVNDHTLGRYSIGDDVLNQYDIRGIENVVIDDYGNVFIKSSDRLNVYNIYTHRLKWLFKSYNLEHTKFDLTGNVLSLAGPLGVVRCTVSGRGTISKVQNYPNVKNIYYTSVTDAQFSKEGVLMKTDKGSFFVNTDCGGGAAQDDYCAYLVSTQDTVRAFHQGDTISIANNITSVNFDIIRPAGSGKWNCRYFIEGEEQKYTGRELLLDNLQPGVYHKAVIAFYDDSWVGNPVTIFVYSEPLWWQSDIGKGSLLAGSVLLLLGIVYLIIVVTRMVVNRNNEKRNQQSNLELKSIHSQINPHFIFNTLSTALYYVNNNENENAFRHISQFSELLQSYIKSSRNKYITISEELENIENYLELQLSRFENKFSYNIHVNQQIDADKVKIPSLILQPIVENALNHGIFHKEGSGSLELTFNIDKTDSHTLIINVDDDGVGRQKSKFLRSTLLKKADSYGSILIKELVEVFNKYEKINISIAYFDKQEPLTGTTVVIKIKDYENAK